MSDKNTKIVKILINLSEKEAKIVRDEADKMSLPLATYCRVQVVKNATKGES